MASSKKKEKKPKLTRMPTKRADRALLREAERLYREEAMALEARGRLRGKVAVITGASRGIGLALAEALGKEGCNLVLASRNVLPLKVVASNSIYQTRVRYVVKSCDVRDPASVDALFAAVKKRFSKIDFLINNAGVAHRLASVRDLSIEEWRSVIDTNLNGMFYCTRAALPLMSRGGVIVNNLSIAATRVFRDFSAYDASKHGALGFTNTLREELREEGIRVLALLVGSTDTDIWEQFMPEADRKKMMPAADVATAVVNAICMPIDAPIEEIRMMPISGLA